MGLVVFTAAAIGNATLAMALGTTAPTLPAFNCSTSGCRTCVPQNKRRGHSDCETCHGGHYLTNRTSSTRSHAHSLARLQLLFFITSCVRTQTQSLNLYPLCLRIRLHVRVRAPLLHPVSQCHALVSDHALCSLPLRCNWKVSRIRSRLAITRTISKAALASSFTPRTAARARQL